MTDDTPKPIVQGSLTCFDSAVAPERADAAGEFLNGLANPNRLMIAAHLLAGEASAGELETALGIRRPALSQQLAGLRKAGVVESRRDEKQIVYRLIDKRAASLVGVLQQVFGPVAPVKAGTPSKPTVRHGVGGDPVQGAVKLARILAFRGADEGQR